MLEIKSPAASVNDIVAIRTVSGEEVIGKLLTQNDNTVVLSRPILVHLQMTQQGAAISFAPFSLSREETDDFIFYRSALSVAPAKVRPDIRANYIKATTGLEVPSTGGLAL